MTSLHTCISCRVAFCDSDAQRVHYKSDWHRYNLKRKVAELPPLSADLFNAKVIEHQVQQSASTRPSTDELRCIPCRKTFNSIKALENHKNSKKHEQIEESSRSRTTSTNEEYCKPTEIVNSEPTESRESEIVDSEPTESRESDSDEWEEGEGGIGLEECLFCSLASKDLDASLEHMSIKHGFFIPDLQYCTDVTNLILYLGQKVGLGYYCLWCDESGKRFHTCDSVQKHMRDKGHCKLQHEGDAMLEYADFFDFGSSYPDAEPGDSTNEANVDPIVMDADWQLVLPSGCVIGHRSLARYFKQNLKPVTTIALNERNRKERLMGQYKALGWVGERGESALRKAKDIKFMNKLRSKQAMKLGVKANKLQPFLRKAE